MLRSRSCAVAAAALLLLIFLYRGTSLLRHRTYLTDLRSLELNNSLSKSMFVSGTPKPAGENYSKTLVVARLESEDVSWVDTSKDFFNKAVYVVDNPSLSPGFQVPRNKGHEAMAYLTYIIDNYDDLSDITIFVHSHRTTWHNNDLLDSDMLTTITHLSEAHVTRQGYFNLRCHHEPGCPDWLHLDRPDDQLDKHRKMEERAFSLDVWHELHPGVLPPRAISQPCCAQFALSKQRIRANPKKEYIRYRDWILNTKLGDIYSGRVMEYTWQYLFAGVPELCPAMNVCYCDGYGICFGGPEQFDDWFKMRATMSNLTTEANSIVEQHDDDKEEDVRELRAKARQIDLELAKLKAEAFERGRDPRLRAQEAGRHWKAGYGY